MKIDIGYIIGALSVLLSGTNIALMDVISYSLRLKIIIGLAVFFTLIIAFVYFKDREKNRKKQI